MIIKRYMTDAEGAGATIETSAKPAGEVVASQKPAEVVGAEEANAAGGDKPEKLPRFDQHPDWIKHQDRMKAAEDKAAEFERQLGESLEYIAGLEEKFEGLSTKAAPSRIQELVEKSKTEDLSNNELVELMLEQQKQFEDRLSGIAAKGEDKEVSDLRAATMAQIMEQDPFYAAGTFPGEGGRPGKPGNVLAFHILGNMAARVDPTGKDAKKLLALVPKAKELTLKSLPDLMVWAAGAKDPGILGKLPEALDKALAAKDPGLVKWLDAHAQGWINKKSKQDLGLPPGGGGSADRTTQKAPLAANINEARKRVAARFAPKE
jgi:hypothetical protein